MPKVKAEGRFIKATAHYLRESRWYSMRWSWPLLCFGIGYFLVFLKWEELQHAVEWSLMGAASNHLGDSYHRLGRGVVVVTFILFFSGFQNSLFMHHTQCSMQYVPSITPINRLTQTSAPSPQNSQFVSQSPQSLMVCFPLQFPPTHFSSWSPSVFRVILYAPQLSETIWKLTISAWIIPLRIISSSPVHVVTKVGYPSFQKEA